MKQELDLMANDPDLAADLKQLKRATKSVATEIQTDLLPSFYDVDTVVDMIGDEYFIVKRQDAQRKNGKRHLLDEDAKHLEDG